MRAQLVTLLAVLAAMSVCRGTDTNLIFNGSFESMRANSDVPEGWAAAGNRAVKQQLVLDAGRDGSRCAKLECAEFTGDGPDYHAMIAQSGKVTVRAGQWYRLTFWAKGTGIRGGGVEVALNNTQPWGSAGLGEAFIVSPKWQRFEMRFAAKRDVAAENSRLQFWFKSTGTLWLDDVTLAATDEGQEWFPQISTAGVKNFVPNSSFECGTAGWGSYTYGLKGWGGGLYRLEGVLDSAVSQHGGHSLKIALKPETLPVFWFDYYEPVRQPVKRVLAANKGWFRVKPGEKVVLSAWLRADTEKVAAQMVRVEAPSAMGRQQVTVGRQWQRYSFAFTPAQPFLFIGVGLDLEASKMASATLWVDSLQLERGGIATDYEPRAPVESFLESPVEDNVFTSAAQGAAFTVRAYNNSEHEETVTGNLSITDFFDATAAENRPALKLPPRAGGSVTLSNACAGRSGYFRASWSSMTGSNSLRAAIITPAPAGLADSPFGFNHAYPWDFLVQSARRAGIVWWRDWSAKWQTVEPEKGHFDFAIPDAQVRRVLSLDSQVEVLLPFPSSSWSTAAKQDQVDKAAGRDSYLRARLPLAFAPQSLNDFGKYAAQTVRHYGAGARPVTHYQMLNEPIYTSYALPRQFGYRLHDYLRLLESAYPAAKKADPKCRVVGGISTGVEAGLTREFVSEGGLRWVDVFDLHMYTPPLPAESFEESFRALSENMRTHGGPKPVWISEWGCYADDDPPCVPHTVGDESMNRSRWPDERQATEHIVRFAAVTFAHGVRKIFFHAGTCGNINGPDAGGVLFEYGGAPRKMYSGISTLTQVLGVPEAHVKTIEEGGLRAYMFRAKKNVVAIAWTRDEPRKLRGSANVRALDIMGNELTGPQMTLGESPVYLIGANVEAVAAMLLP